MARGGPGIKKKKKKFSCSVHSTAQYAVYNTTWNLFDGSALH